MSTLAAPRLAYVDNLRLWLTVLVVLHHAAVVYSPLPVWPYHEPGRGPTSVLLLLFLVLNQMWFMSAFFAISGLFAPGSIDRKGARAFSLDRLRRLGIPLLVFLVLLNPLMNLHDYPSAGAGTSPLHWWADIATPQYMWFVQTLLVMSLVYAGWRHLRRGRPAAPVVGQGLPRPRTFLAFAAGLTAAVWLWRIMVPTETTWPVVGLPTPDHLPLYVTFFWLGTLALRRGWLEALTMRAAWTGAAAAVAGVAVYLAVVITSPDTFAGGGSWQSLVAVAATVAMALGLTAAALVLFRTWFAAQVPPLRFLADNAYAVYFVHGPVLVLLALVLAPMDAPAVAKFALLAVTALPVCWAVARAVRAIPGARRVL
ncbi:Acyltransferase family protein [Promicromonospora umidemergens]|uniref:Acyltransferase n=1 Tax=Promicromonospora umidemergens TaxID=629679 RepID=A0ABP8WWB6_9MICO|nr:acyltransferase family protein [Promicromonospora umidemergens]MCP2285754.1 Acyltransferase family protein [Promicromonospora umidemergens]